MNKIRVPGILLLCFCSFLLGGCTQKGGDVSGTAAAAAGPQYEWGTVSGRTLTVWGRETDLNRIYMKRAFQRYEELTGNRVQVVAMEPGELEEKGAQALKSGEGAPDLLLSFGGVNMEVFSPDESFYDFSDAAWVDDLTDTSINQTIYNGKVMGLPHWEASVSGTIYNKEIFEKLHIDPPRTQEEFMEACRILLENKVTPLYLPCAEDTMLLYQFPLDCLVEDAQVLQELNGGRIGYRDLPQMEVIVEWYRTMAENGYLGSDYMQNDWNGMNSAMDSGEYAMMLCWDTWLYTDFEGDASRFGLMPAFVGLPEKGTFEGPNLALLLVNRNGEQVDAALDLVTFMADPYNYNAAFEGIYTAPVFKGQQASISTPQYAENAGWIEEVYHDSVAWLRIRGFSQSDASCILDYMQAGGDYTVQQCLTDMDRLRRERADTMGVK